MLPLEHDSESGPSSRRQPEGRIPLQPLTANPPTENTIMNQQQQPVVNVIHHQYTRHQDYDNGTSSNTSIRPTTATKAGAPTSNTSSSTNPVESFELEGGNNHDNADNNTVNSGGTSWTLRIPWLRRKRHRRIRHDDENSSLHSHQSRSVISHIGVNGGSSSSGGRRRDHDTRHNNDAEAVYYGGVMRTSSPSSVYEEANDAADGLHHHQQQQHQNPTRMEQHPGSALPEQHLPLDSLPQHDHSQPPGTQDGTSKTPTASNMNSNNSKGRRFSMMSSFGLETRNNNKVFRNRSWISTSSNGSTDPKSGSRSQKQRQQHRNQNGEIHFGGSDDSLADFDEAEWTPQDSAYGAAIPICGWVPKRLRQFIEATLIAFTVFALVYMVVTTSMQIQENKQNGNHHSYYNGSSSYNVDANKFDDDWYVEFSQYTNDEDDYFDSGNGNNNAAAGGDDRGG